MRVVEAGDDGAAVEVEHPRRRAAQRQHVAAVARRGDRSPATASADTVRLASSRVWMRALWTMRSGAVMTPF